MKNKRLVIILILIILTLALVAWAAPVLVYLPIVGNGGAVYP